jgi:hypothetical protein
MICQKANLKKTDQSDLAIWQINVTDLTPDQRSDILRNYFNRGGFVGFIKHCQNKQLYYIFIYRNYKLTGQAHLMAVDGKLDHT